MFKFLLNVLTAMGSQPLNSTPVSHTGSKVNNVQLQVQDITGNWRTCQETLNNSQWIITGMRQLSGQFPGQRVRAIDSDGRIVDIL